MRLARGGIAGAEAPIVSGADGRWHDLTPIAADIDGAFLSADLDRARSALAAGELPEVDAPHRFGPPLARVGKVVCIGLNYRDHAAETGADVPAEPVVFLKTPDTVIGPDDEVLVPRKSVKTDYEVELAIVLGGQARYLESPEAAGAVIAGYAISNDLSEREFQFERGGQWDKGKGCETFNPFGPWIRTTDDVPDPQALRMRLWVNGDLRQNSSTSEMIFNVHYLVWYLSQFMVLRAGDVINTGTPAGVALGRADGAFLRAGDVVELEIDGLGRQRQTLAQA
jgi:2-keto-4-pentenoate hydratase/2-oxohepta-3-ene-1,7-dioic acid hydratase in catechol pathway